jgi:hypothetical protein
LDQSTTPVSFNITAKDVNGKTVTTGGDNYVITSSGTPPTSFFLYPLYLLFLFQGGLAFTQTYLGAGVYQVTYTPSVAGTFEISIELNGFAPIVNSPFTVTIDSTRTSFPSLIPLFFFFFF